jgi:translocation and assembly module TamB
LPPPVRLKANLQKTPHQKVFNVTMKRALAWLLLIAVLLGGLGLFAASETALRWTIEIAAQRLPGEFSTQSVRGNLFGPIMIDGLRYQTADILVEVKQSTLEWHPFALLGKQLHIERLAVEDVSIRMMQSGEAAPTVAAPSHPTGFSSPVNLRVDDVVIDGIRRQPSEGAEQRLDRVHISARLDGTTLTIDALDIDAPRGSLTVTGRADTRDLSLDLRTTWRARFAEYKTLAGDGSLSGNVNELRVEQTLRAPAEAKLHATLRDLAQNPAWNARLDLPAFNLHRVHDDWPMLVLAGNVEAHGGFASPWEIDNLTLELPGEGSRVEAQGRVSLDENTIGYDAVAATSSYPAAARTTGSRWKATSRHRTFRPLTRPWPATAI